jgi:hypothetical protein
VGMIQRCQHPRFTFKSRHAFAVVTECFGKEFDGNAAAQLRVGGLVDIPLPPEPRCDVIS